MKRIYRKLMTPVGVMLLAPLISAGDPTIDATCSVSRAWSAPLPNVPTEWLDELDANIVTHIEAVQSPDTVVAKMMLMEIRLNIQAALDQTSLTDAAREALGKMLVSVNDEINSSDEALLARAVELGKNTTKALTNDITTQLAGTLGATNGVSGAVGANLVVEGQYVWCEGHFDTGLWNLGPTTLVRGLTSTGFSALGEGQLSTAVGVALGAHASVEAPATVKVSAAVTAAVIGERVTPVVAVKNKYTFQPAYSMSFKCTVNIEAGWGLNLGSGSTFTYLVPSADAAVNSIVLAPQTLTIEENDPNVICVQPAR